MEIGRQECIREREKLQRVLSFEVPCSPETTAISFRRIVSLFHNIPSNEIAKEVPAVRSTESSPQPSMPSTTRRSKPLVKKEPSKKSAFNDDLSRAQEWFANLSLNSPKKTTATMASKTVAAKKTPVQKNVQNDRSKQSSDDHDRAVEYFNELQQGKDGQAENKVKKKGVFVGRESTAQVVEENRHDDHAGKTAKKMATPAPTKRRSARSLPNSHPSAFQSPPSSKKKPNESAASVDHARALDYFRTLRRGIVPNEEDVTVVEEVVMDEIDEMVSPQKGRKGTKRNLAADRLSEDHARAFAYYTSIKENKKSSKHKRSQSHDQNQEPGSDQETKARPNKKRTSMGCDGGDLVYFREIQVKETIRFAS